MNPLEYTHQKLWDVLNASPEFQALVPPPKQLRLEMFYIPQLATALTEADTPRVQLALRQYQFQHAASNLILCSLTWDVLGFLAGSNANELMRLLWAIHQAILQPDWLTDPYIHAVRVTAAITEPQKEDHRIWQGLMCQIVVDVHMPIRPR
ncbi:MAG: hypothetical protein NZ821_06000 [Gloeomargarita sp. SKYB31]|nr:hypothetical protein [Gloeomargarita sp. SKYB31]